MPGLVPGMTSLNSRWPEGVDGRDEPGHDEENRKLLSNYFTIFRSSVFSTLP